MNKRMLFLWEKYMVELMERLKLGSNNLSAHFSVCKLALDQKKDYFNWDVAGLVFLNK